MVCPAVLAADPNRLSAFSKTFELPAAASESLHFQVVLPQFQPLPGIDQTPPPVAVIADAGVALGDSNRHRILNGVQHVPVPRDTPAFG